MPPMVKRLKYI